MTLPIARVVVSPHSQLEMAEEILLPRVAAGEADAMERCVERYGPLVWSAARRFLGSSHEAEDVVQETFIHLWRDAHRFDASRGSETTFVMVIARRRLLDCRRRLGRLPEVSALEEGMEPAVGNSVVVDGDDEAEQAMRLLRGLPPEQQQIIELSLRDGHTHQEISSRLEIPLGTVKTLLRRGLLRLRQALAGSKMEASS